MSTSGGTQTKAAQFFLAHLFHELNSDDNYENINNG